MTLEQFIYGALEHWKLIAFITTGVLTVAEGRWQLQLLKRQAKNTVSRSECDLKHANVEKLFESIREMYANTQQLVQTNNELLIKHIERNNKRERS